jgi:uncharacterized protein (DUF924 family)
MFAGREQRRANCSIDEDTMTSAPDPVAQSVLTLWFGDLDAHGMADPAHRRTWFTKDGAFDALLCERFLSEHEAIVAGQREAWLATPGGRLAYVIVLDQFSRNMFRGSGRMFAADEQARRAAVEGIDRGDDRALAVDERPFLYMPLMHSERLEDHDRCLALFTALRDEVGDGPARAGVESGLKFAVMHRDIIVRFGRYPHRTRLLVLARRPPAQPARISESPEESDTWPRTPKSGCVPR